MTVRKIRAKAILSRSKIFPYVINPYVGCQHGCSYCYARFMKRFTGHKQPWGEFVDVKINAPELLLIEIAGKKPGQVWVSGVCDPYQPLEEKYQITRRCLEILAKNNWPAVIQTKSPLVLRDMDIIKAAKHTEVGFSIATADDNIRKLFEPSAPPVKDRIITLDKLHRVGIPTFAMIAPMLPGCEKLPYLLADKIDHVIIDRMNYHHADRIYKKYHLEDQNTDDYFQRTGRMLKSAFQKLGIKV